MAEVIIQNLRYPDQIITAVVTIKRMIVYEDNPSALQWVLEASTRATGPGGVKVKPTILYRSSKETVTKDINDLITALCKKVDWVHEVDNDPPEVVGQWPLSEEQNVAVDTTIRFILWEEPPASGVDMTSIRVKVKGYDLTDKLEISGDMTRCSVSVTPGTKYQSAVKISAN